MIRWKVALPAFLITLLISTFQLSAQQPKPFVVSGYVRDEQTGEALINATITVTNPPVNVQSNAYGFYSMSLPAGDYELLVTYAGYSTFRKKIQLDKNLAPGVYILQVRDAAMQVESVKFIIN